MDRLTNKRLLVLGGTLSTYDVVKTAKEMGIYVIVADYLEGGPAKEIADETVLVSTTDMDALSNLIKEKNIDGVFTGASEFNIRNMITLCEKNGLLIYSTTELWNTLSNKKRFKDTCRKYNVPVVPEYIVADEASKDAIEYPVIVKPVDSFSGHGISVCHKKEDLQKSIEYAEANSRTGKYIIEKYITGKNVEVYCLVQDGEVYLLSASDRYTNKEQGGAPVPVAFYHPSKYVDTYLEKVHSYVQTMFKEIGVKNGVFFMESFLVDESNFMFYEMGFRLNATMEYHFIEYFNGFSPLKMMISYALTGTMGENVSKLNDPHLNGKQACEIALLLKTGKISEIKGIEKINEEDFIIHTIQFYNEGDVLNETGNLNQNFARIKVVADTKEELEDRIEYVYNEVSVRDENGNEMLIKEGRPTIYD